MPEGLGSPLDAMKSVLGTSWDTGDGPSPTIGGWLQFIADRYPRMGSYCHSAMHMDYFQWCGLSVAYSMAKSNITPVFGDKETSQFLYAKAWLDWGQPVSTPVLGDVVVLDFGGGHQHVTLYDGNAGNGFWACLGGNQSHQVKVSNFSKSSVMGVRRPPGAQIGTQESADGGGVDDPSVVNKYPDFPVVAYAKTTTTVGEIAAALAAFDADIDIKRAAYALICNEAASGRAGINNNYGGLQADAGRWSQDYDVLISASCVVKDSSGVKRRFLCFPGPKQCYFMIRKLIEKRGIYVGGTTSFITNMQVNDPADWALAYYREWVTGDANATLPQPQLHSLLSLYQSAIDALP